MLRCMVLVAKQRVEVHDTSLNGLAYQVVS